MNKEYILYHIPGKKIGVTCDLYNRVTEQQGYEVGEYEVIETSNDIDYISKRELKLQKKYGYRVDLKPYNELNNNLKLKNMKINVTEQTTTFPCPLNKLKGRLMDNLEMHWQTEHGDVYLDNESAKWIVDNAKTSMFNNSRCYVYNKAFSRYYDNHKDRRLDNAYQMNLVDQYNGKCRSGALSPAGMPECDKEQCECLNPSHFDLIREWAETRGLYNEGDPKTQTLKLMEEAGEICRAVLKKDEPEIIDGIGDCVVVLTNLAHLCDTSIEECIEAAYNEIKGRSGKMVNGTFKKD